MGDARFSLEARSSPPPSPFRINRLRGKTMATKNISGFNGAVVDVTTSGNTWNLLKNAEIVSTDYGFHGAAGVTNSVFNIDGRIQAIAIGILHEGPRMTVDIGKTGRIEAANGIYMAGTQRLDAQIAGEIVSAQYAVYSVAARAEVTVANGAYLMGQYGIYMAGSDRLDATINGEVHGAQYGLLSTAEQSDVRIGVSGLLSGIYGIALLGPDASLANEGRIVGLSGYGVAINAPGVDLRNSGEISGTIGIYGTGDRGRIVNAEDGSITGVTSGIMALTTSGETLTVINHGRIAASDMGPAISIGAGDDRVISDGQIRGDITLQDGNDFVDLTGGTLRGVFNGGIGDDTLVTGNAAHKLVENAGEGIDTVKATVSYTLSDFVDRLILIGAKDIDGGGNNSDNILHGNAGDNDLRGKASGDDLYGHKGNDKLYGGTGSDDFYFSTGDGHDTIMDIDAVNDDVDLSGWDAISTLTQLLNHAHNDGNGNVIIEAGSDSLMIKGVLKGDLDLLDFAFA
jgi:Ca2+-binding RTX toxin-like protein